TAVELWPHVISSQTRSGEGPLVVQVLGRRGDDRPVAVGHRAELRVGRQVAGQPVKLRRVVAEIVGSTVALAVQDDEVPVPDVIRIPALAPSPGATAIVARPGAHAVEVVEVPVASRRAGGVMAIVVADGRPGARQERPPRTGVAAAAGKGR